MCSKKRGYTKSGAIFFAPQSKKFQETFADDYPKGMDRRMGFEYWKQ